MRNQTALALLAALLLCSSVSANIEYITNEFTATTFDKTALSSWTTTGLADPQVSTCGSVSLVGGYKIGGKSSIQKTFSLNYTPTSVYITFDLYLLDSWKVYWKNTDLFYLYVRVNGAIAEQISTNFANNKALPLSNICGESANDRQTHVGLTVPFTSNSLNFTLEGYTVATSEFPGWGIRNLQIMSNFGTDEKVVFSNELSNESTFAAEAAKWTYLPTSKASAIVQTCNGASIVGGLNAAAVGTSATRTISGLPSHQFLSLKFQGYWIDSVDINDTVGFLLDNVIVHETGRTPGTSVNMCGSGTYNDRIENFEILVPHSASSFTFQVVTNFDQTDESFGFRNFTVSTASPCPVVYSEVNGQGNSYQFCQNIPNFKNIGWTVPIKGIYIPAGQSVTLYQDSDYTGKKLVVSASNYNLSGEVYTLINRAFNIDVEEKPNQRLRHQN